MLRGGCGKWPHWITVNLAERSVSVVALTSRFIVSAGWTVDCRLGWKDWSWWKNIYSIQSLGSASAALMIRSVVSDWLVLISCTDVSYQNTVCPNLSSQLTLMKVQWIVCVFIVSYIYCLQ